MDHVNISYSRDSTTFVRETFVLIIQDSNTKNISFNMEHSDKHITLTTCSHSLRNVTAAITAVIKDSIFENLQNSSPGYRISYSVFLKCDLFQPLDSGRGLSLQSLVFGMRINDAQIVHLTSPIEVYFQADEVWHIILSIELCFMNLTFSLWVEMVNPFVEDGTPQIMARLKEDRWFALHCIGINLAVGGWDTTACEASPLNTNGSPLYKTRFSQFGHFGVLLVRLGNGDSNYWINHNTYM